ncbi:MAG: hypothetical protein ABIQ41_09035 [Gemmatimonadales bacterium]
MDALRTSLHPAIREDEMPLRMLCECRLTPVDPVRLDQEGFVVCPTHGVRRYGWLSVPYQANRGNFGSYFPLEYEQHILFGIELVREISEIKVTVEDIRFNDDPMAWVRKSRSKVKEFIGRRDVAA